jgi:Tol biopolymer transport system component
MMKKTYYLILIIFLCINCFKSPVELVNKMVVKTEEVVFFSSDRNSNATNIFMMSKEGKLLKQITNYDEDVCVATGISPSGTELLFTKGGRIYLYKFKEDTIIGPFTHGHSGNFSSDGKKFVFHRHASNYESVYLYNLEDGTEAKLTEDGNTSFYPQISPLGDYICYESAKFSFRDSISCWQLHLMDLSGNFIKDLTLKSHGYYAGKGVFTPDGKSVIFHYNESTYCYDICKVEIENNEISYLTTTKINGNWTVPNYKNPSVSPDGQRVYFNSKTRNLQYPVPHEIYVINIDGSGQKRLTFTKYSESHPISGIVTYRILE